MDEYAAEQCQVPVPDTPVIAIEGGVLTVQGLTLISKLLASRAKLEFTRAGVGDGTAPAGKAYETLTALVHPVRDANIARIYNPANGEATVTVQVSSQGVQQGYFIREIGLFAKDPDLGEIMYAYVAMPEHPQWIRPEGLAISNLTDIDVIVIVDRVEQVVAKISPSSMVSRQDIVDHDNGKSAHVNAFAAHNTDANAHSGIRTAISKVQTDVQKMLQSQGGRLEVVPQNTTLPPSERKEGMFYLCVKSTQSMALPNQIQVSPTMTLRPVD